MSKFRSSHPEHTLQEDWVEIHPLSTEVISGNDGNNVATPPGSLPRGTLSVTAMLYLIDAGTLVGDELDVFVQTEMPTNGTDQWIDVIHFNKVLGNGAGDFREYGKVTCVAACAMFETVAGAALAAAAVRNILGRRWRTRWEIVDGGGTHSFEFRVSLYPQG